MIQANELRIGNLLERDGNIIEVVRISKENVINYETAKEKTGMHTNSGRVNPIPLTEELLLKCGFEVDDSDEDNKWLNLRYGNIVFCSDESTNFERVYLRIYNTDIILESLHQLQNIFFALTNQELKIIL